jgi:arylsulfatase A-like enzyme
MKSIILLAVSSLIVLAVAERSQADERRPNIILVLADDMGWSDIGCYGGEIPTPHIDQLANNGLRFRQFYNNAICGPTRSSLLTGLYCQQIGHMGTRWNEATDFRHCVGLGEMLQPAGYRTLMVGKWQERELPAKHGFNRFFGPMCQAKISYFNEVQQNPFYLDEQRWSFPADDFYMTDALTDRAVSFIEEAVKPSATHEPVKPFFLYLAYLAPHWPLHAREADIAPHRERYRKQGWDEWRAERFKRQKEIGLTPSNWTLSPRPSTVHEWKTDKNPEWQAERMAVYAAQVDSIDRGVGRVMKAVRAAGVEENTLVMFLSDNGAAPDGGLIPTDAGFGFGPEAKNDAWRLDGVAIRPGSSPKNPPGPHDTFAAYGLAWANVSNAPLRGTKLTAYEGGIRTPLVVHWPAVIRKDAGSTNQPGHVMDLMATFLDVAGARYPDEFKGRKLLPLEGASLLPIFHGKKRREAEMHCWNTPQNQAIRIGSWKLINGGRGKPWELYDLDADGTETTDLASKHPKRVQEMSARWESWSKRCELSK